MYIPAYVINERIGCSLISVIPVSRRFVVLVRVTRFEFVKKKTLRRGGRVRGPACYTLAYPASSPATKCPLFHKLKSGHPNVNALIMNPRDYAFPHLYT